MSPVREWAGELVIDLPKHDPRFENWPIAHKVGVLEHKGGTLKPLMGVMKCSLHFMPQDVTTADLEFDGGKRETWLVVAIREGK